MRQDGIRKRVGLVLALALGVCFAFVGSAASAQTDASAHVEPASPAASPPPPAQAPAPSSVPSVVPAPEPPPAEPPDASDETEAWRDDYGIARVRHPSAE